MNLYIFTYPYAILLDCIELSFTNPVTVPIIDPGETVLIKEYLCIERKTLIGSHGNTSSFPAFY